MENVPDRRGSLTSRAGWKFAKEIGLLPPHATPGTPCLYDFWQKRGVIPTMTWRTFPKAWWRWRVQHGATWGTQVALSMRNLVLCGGMCRRSWAHCTAVRLAPSCALMFPPPPHIEEQTEGQPQTSRNGFCHLCMERSLLATCRKLREYQCFCSQIAGYSRYFRNTVRATNAINGETCTVIVGHNLNSLILRLPDLYTSPPKTCAPRAWFEQGRRSIQTALRRHFNEAADSVTMLRRQKIVWPSNWADPSTQTQVAWVIVHERAGRIITFHFQPGAVQKHSKYCGFCYQKQKTS